MIHSLPMKGRVVETGRTITITFKLFALLERFLPEGARRNEIRLSVPDGTTPGAIIAALDLPVALCALVIRNGVFVPPETRDTEALVDGDTLAIWPPIAGG